MAERPVPKLTKTLKYLQLSDCYIGKTRDLKHLMSLGYQLRYDVCGNTYPVRYAPRSRTDPFPWIQVGGLECRLSSGEIGAY